MASAEGFIKGALTGGNGKSNGIVTESIGKGQRVMRAFAMDNVQLVEPTESSLKKPGHFGGSTSNLGHSLKGASAVDDGTGAS